MSNRKLVAVAGGAFGLGVFTGYVFTVAAATKRVLRDAQATASNLNKMFEESEEDFKETTTE